MHKVKTFEHTYTYTDNTVLATAVANEKDEIAF